MIDVYHILTECIENLRKQIVIELIVDNGDDTYTIHLQDAYLLHESGNIKIIETDNFNGNYRIFDVGNDYFSIKKTSGVNIGAYGYAIFYINFLYDSFTEAKNIINDAGLTELTNTQKMPLVLSLLDNKGTVINSLLENDFLFYLIVPTENGKGSKWRNLNTLPFLRKLEHEFIKGLKKHPAIIPNFDYSRTELFFEGSKDKNQNKLNLEIDAIEISTKIKILINYKNCTK